MAALGGGGIRNVWPVLFLLGTVLLNRPFLGIFDRNDRFFGIPLFYLYLFTGWLAGILMIYLFVRLLSARGKEER